MILSSIIKTLPDNPGIYLYYNQADDLIYVGKATSLKSRVRSYFVGKRSDRPIETMLHEVVDIKWKETDSVLEAVILESVYIKKYLPKYNVLGKDNKSWNYITISKDVYPIVGTVRQHEIENLKLKISNVAAPYVIPAKAGIQKEFEYVFGPYPGLNTRGVMKILRRLFYFSTCQVKPRRGKQNRQNKPCFYYQIGQCLGVCTGEITPAEYKRKVIRPLILFLEGKKQTVVRSIEQAMKVASKQENFEEAARLRNQLSALNRIQDIALINKDFFVDINTGSRLSRDDNQSLVRRIEGYDISNLGSTGKVGSMVVFDTNGAIKSDYRKFKIKTVVGQSDVDCLEEVIRRRLRHSEWAMPDIFLIDGGPPQVNRVQKVLRELENDTPVVGIAKGPERKRNDFYFGNKTNKPLVQWVSEHQDLLIKVRDEAHRFAITYQRSLRKLK